MAFDQPDQDDGDEIQVEKASGQLSKGYFIRRRNCHSDDISDRRYSDAGYLLYIGIPRFSETAEVDIRGEILDIRYQTLEIPDY